ncbi:hypothetical protein, partial [Corynebacterium ciconiae]
RRFAPSEEQRAMAWDSLADEVRDGRRRVAELEEQLAAAHRDLEMMDETAGDRDALEEQREALSREVDELRSELVESHAEVERLEGVCQEVDALRADLARRDEDVLSLEDYVDEVKDELAEERDKLDARLEEVRNLRRLVSWWTSASVGAMRLACASPDSSNEEELAELREQCRRYRRKHNADAKNIAALKTRHAGRIERMKAKHEEQLDALRRENEELSQRLKHLEDQRYPHQLQVHEQWLREAKEELHAAEKRHLTDVDALRSHYQRELTKLRENSGEPLLRRIARQAERLYLDEDESAVERIYELTEPYRKD